MARRRSELDQLSEAAGLITSFMSTRPSVVEYREQASRNFASSEGEILSLFPSAEGRPGSGPSAQPQQTILPSPTSSSMRFGARQNFSSWAGGNRRKRATRHVPVEHRDSFHKDVILLPDPTWAFVVKQGAKEFLHENGHILSAFEIKKTWEQSIIFSQIRDAFGPKIPDDVSLEFIMACGNKLVKPKLRDGQLMDGHMLHKVYKSKALYVRPDQTILVKGESDTDDDQSSEFTESQSSGFQGPGRSTRSTAIARAYNQSSEFTESQSSGFQGPGPSTRSTARAYNQSSGFTESQSSGFQSPGRSTRSTARAYNQSSEFTESQSSGFQGPGPSTRSTARAYQPQDTAEDESPKEDDCVLVVEDHTACSSTPSRHGGPILSNTGGSTSSNISTVFGAPFSQEVSVPSSAMASSSHLASSSEYNTYVALTQELYDLSSDEEDVNRAIIASLETEHAHAAQPVCVKDILVELATKITTQARCKFNINRAAVLDGAFRGFRRTTYNPNATMNIKFSDDLGRNEEAVDLGGPTREFLRLLMEALVLSPMFEGGAQSHNLALNAAAHGEDKYFLAGVAIAVSLVHGGPSPAFLSKTLFNCLAKGSHTARPVLEDIADPEVYSQVKLVSESSTFAELMAATGTEKMLGYLERVGCLRPLRTFADKERLLRDILMSEVVTRVAAPFERFKDGLKTLGILENIQKHPESFRPLFCHQDTKLSADSMDDLFIIGLSPLGSNRRTLEEAVVVFWREFLEDAQAEEGHTKLEKILAFATGADVVPPIGFNPSPSIGFLHEEEDDATAVSTLPLANTCINYLKLPLHNTYAVFKEKMDFALANTQGFGRR